MWPGYGTFVGTVRGAVPSRDDASKSKAAPGGGRWEVEWDDGATTTMSEGAIRKHEAVVAGAR